MRTNWERALEAHSPDPRKVPGGSVQGGGLREVLRVFGIDPDAEYTPPPAREVTHAAAKQTEGDGEDYGWARGYYIASLTGSEPSIEAVAREAVRRERERVAQSTPAKLTVDLESKTKRLVADAESYFDYPNNEMLPGFLLRLTQAVAEIGGRK